MKSRRVSPWRFFLWALEGIAVGLGGILPGVSGGTLCAAFGMYRPMVECISHPVNGMKKHGWMLGWFLAGGVAGFVGLAGISARLLEAFPLEVTWCFLGMLAGTFPSLWRDAGTGGRSKKGYLSLITGFFGMVCILWAVKSLPGLFVSADGWGFVLCGVFWGLSFLVPGLSASSLLLFLGLYEPMLAGIGGLDPKVLLPLGAGLVFTLLLLGKLCELGFQKHREVLSHGVLGTVAATAVMAVPGGSLSAPLWFLLGMGLSYTLTSWGTPTEKAPVAGAFQRAG